MAVVNDIIGLIRDSSGNGNDATQTTAASKPKLQQDANGYYYLEFDGADDTLSLGNLVHGNASTYITSIEPGIFTLPRILGSSNNAFYIHTTASRSVRFVFGSETLGSGSIETPGNVVVSGQKIIIVCIRDSNANLAQIWVNGVKQAETTHNQPGATLSTYIASNGGATFSALKLSGVVVNLDEALTEFEIKKTTQLLAMKCGVTL